MPAVFLLVFAFAVAAANARAEHSAAADVPTLTKSVTTGITNPDATNGYFTITVHIPTADTPKIVYVRDDGTLLVGSSPNTGACIGATPWRCRVDAADLVLRISKPLSLATNAPHFCAAGTLSNSASMTDNDGNPIATSNTVELAVPAKPDETCGRTVTICKVVVDNNDGVTDSATFGGGVVGTTTNTTWATSGNVSEISSVTSCVTKTVGASESVTVSETTPAGWADATGFPQYFLGAGSCTGAQTALDTGAVVGTSDINITICNKAAQHTRGVQVCKYVVDNAALPADEGGAFGGALTPSAGTGGDWSVGGQTEGATASCNGNIVIVGNATFTLSESTIPTGWGNATGFPQYVIGTATCSANGTDSALTANTTFAATVTKVTICNKQSPTTRQITICKVVVPNGDATDDGGGFGGKVIVNKVEYVWSVTGAIESSQQPKCSTSITVPLDAGFDVTETAFPAGWSSAASFPFFVAGSQTCLPADQVADLAPQFGSSVIIVTVCNQKAPPPPTRTVTICKAVLSNGDGVTDGGDFSGTLTPSTGTGGAWAVTVVNEGGSKCADAITIDAAATFAVSESGVPAAWTNETGSPKYVTSDDICTADANALSGKTFAATVTKVTVCNQRVQHTRGVTICKAVLDNGDGVVDGGDFSGTLTPSAGTGDNWSTTGVNEGASKCSDAAITLVANATFTLSETGTPSGWTNESGYPKYVTGDATCSTTAEALSGKTFDATTTKVTVCNRRVQHTRGVTICKAVLENNDTIVDSGDFGGTLSPSAGVPGAWATTGVSEGGSKCADAILIIGNATFTLSEGSLPSGWTSVSGFPKYVTGTGICSDQASALDGQVTFAATVTKVTVCNKKTPATGTIRITKIDLTSGHATWNFTVSGPTVIADQSVLGGNTTGASKDVTGLVLNASAYTVTELGANLTTGCPADNTNPNLVKVTQTSGVGGIALTTAGQVAEFTFLNEPCGLAGSLVVTKVRDNNGNHIQDGLDTTITWTVKIAGPSYPAGQLFTVSGTRVFSALIPGVYTIEETDGAPAYKTVGVVTSDAGFSASRTATTTLTSGDTDTITFYNQPRVSVRVVKTERRFGVDGPGSGWTFTLTGCAVAARQATTGGSGVVTFNDLPPAIGCAYTVTEDAVADWTASPALSQRAAPVTAGETVTITFVNTWHTPESVLPATQASPPASSSPAPSTAEPPTPVRTAVTSPVLTVTPAVPRTADPARPAASVVAGESPVVVPRPPLTGSGGAQAGQAKWWLAGLGLALFAASCALALRRR